MTYEETQTEVRTREGIKDTPSSLIEKWSALVEECEEGYSWDFSEYLNEIRARDAIEVLLSDQQLARYPEHDDLVKAVAVIDQRFRGLLNANAVLPHERSWWRQGVLKRAGAAYVEYMNAAHGISVDVQR